jgi:hypothetical protein
MAKGQTDGHKKRSQGELGRGVVAQERGGHGGVQSRVEEPVSAGVKRQQPVPTWQGQLAQLAFGGCRGCTGRCI